jgi:hypothetical protein
MKLPSRRRGIMKLPSRRRGIMKLPSRRRGIIKLPSRRRGIIKLPSEGDASSFPSFGGVRGGLSGRLGVVVKKG